MDASRSRLCLYDAARQAIRDASAGGAKAEAVGRDQDARVAARAQHDDHLDKNLHRSVEEMYHSTRGKQNSTQGTQDVQFNGNSSNEKRQRHDGEEAPAEVAGDASDGEEGHATTQEDECLGLMAEAFADDLDLLRKDEHFGGSANDIAAMADMMRYFPASACGRCVCRHTMYRGRVGQHRTKNALGPRSEMTVTTTRCLDALRKCTT